MEVEVRQREGQQEVLAKMGITERALGVEVRSSMEVVDLGEVAPAVPVYSDKHAYIFGDWLTSFC